EGFDDPARPSGGNHYDRRVCAALAEAGWEVQVTTVAGAWPDPAPDARADLARIMCAVPDGGSVLIDGLIASPAAAHAAGHRPRQAPRHQRALLRTRRAPSGHQRGGDQRVDPPAGSDPLRAAG